MIKTMRNGRTVEIGTVGIEGITDPTALFGIDDAVMETIVQIPGTAFCIRRDTLQREMMHDDALRGILKRYARLALLQLAQTAACNRLHSLEQRCCRWLLIAHDGALSDHFPFTHELLAMMLGVHRAGVSIAAQELQRSGLIDYRRGMITVTDRAGLERAACECYAVIQSELAKVLTRGRAVERAASP